MILNMVVYQRGYPSPYEYMANISSLKKPGQVTDNQGILSEMVIITCNSCDSFFPAGLSFRATPIATQGDKPHSWGKEPSCRPTGRSGLV